MFSAIGSVFKTPANVVTVISLFAVVGPVVTVAVVSPRSLYPASIPNLSLKS